MKIIETIITIINWWAIVSAVIIVPVMVLIELLEVIYTKLFY